MIPKAARKERANMSVAAGTGYSVNVYSISTNRTFVMTDLVFSTTDTGEGLLLYDGASAATPTAGTEKMFLRGNPWVMTDIQNGPEFSTGVAAALSGNRALPTFAVMDWRKYLPSTEMGRWDRKVNYISSIMQVNPCISFLYCS